MHSLRKYAALSVLVLAIGTMSGAGAQAAERGVHSAAGVCSPVHAAADGQDLGDGSTVATVTVDGYRIGTTAATFTPTGMRGDVLLFTGPIVFTPDVAIGTLTAQVDGSFNTRTGTFRSHSSSVTGTDLLAGVSGRLRFRGLENLTDGSFTETITGRLCSRT
jgi:hypothetical protein